MELRKRSVDRLHDWLVARAAHHVRDLRARAAPKPTATEVLDFLENFRPPGEFDLLHRARVAPRIVALLETWV